MRKIQEIYCTIIMPFTGNYLYSSQNAKKPPLARRLFAKRGLERREVEKRIYGGERLRLTASAAFHGYTITQDFEQPITEILTIHDEIVNIPPTIVFTADTQTTPGDKL